MKLSREQIVHLSHLVFNYLNEDEGVEFFADLPEIRQDVFRLIEGEMKTDELIDALVRRKLESQKRPIPEGSEEWEIMYRRYYEEESARHRKVLP